MRWPHDLGETGHARVESIPGIESARSVVEIAVSLTWRAADGDVDRAEPLDESALRRCRWLPQPPVEQRFDPRGADARAGKVPFIDPRSERIRVNREYGLQLPVERATGLPNPQRHQAAAAEEID